MGVLGEGQAGSILCNWPVCLVAAGEDCISIQEGTFTWSQESAPCLHRYRWWPWEQPSLGCWRGGGGRESESSHRWTGNRVSEPCLSGRRCPPGPQAGHTDVDGGLAKRSPREPWRLLSLLYRTGHCLLQPPALWLGLCGRKPQPTAKLPMKGEETPWTVSVLLVIHSFHGVYRALAMCQALF